MSSKMSKICDKSVFVICRPINTHYCPSRGCTLQHNLHSVFSQRPCSPDTYFAMQCYSRVHYFALYFSCIFNLKRIGSLVNVDDDFHNLLFPTSSTSVFPSSFRCCVCQSLCQHQLFNVVMLCLRVVDILTLIVYVCRLIKQFIGS